MPIPPGRSFEIEAEGEYGHGPFIEEYACMMTVSFDNGAYEITYKDRNMYNTIPADIYNEKCDPTSTINDFRKRLNKYPPLKDGWTYTFTNADYDAAVTYSQSLK